MGEILFKAKRIDNGEWVQGFLFKMQVDGGYTWCIGEEPLTANDYSEIVGCGRTWFFINHHTLCQYTGLTDKNGNKIWENDVVKKHFYTDYDAYANSEEYVGFVKYEDFAWVIKSPKSRMIRTFPIIEAIAYSKDVKHFELIGNIFDNPELINRTDF